MMVKVLVVSVVLFASLPALGAAQSFNNAGSSWNGSWGFASTSERALGLSQAQAIRSARQSSAPGTVIYQTTNTTTTNTNTVGAMNTGDTTVTVAGDGNTLSTTSAADSTGCLDGSVSWLTAEAGQTGATGSYYFSVTDSSAAPACP